MENSNDKVYYNYNPFLNNDIRVADVIDDWSKLDKTNITINQTANIIVNNINCVGHYREIKKRKYTQVGEGSYYLIIKAGLNIHDVIVYHWIIENIGWESDTIAISPTELTNRIYEDRNDKKSETKLSRTPIYEAINKLISVGILARKKGYTQVFFVNPDYIYKGDPLFLYREARKKLNEEKTKTKVLRLIEDVKNGILLNQDNFFLDESDYKDPQIVRQEMIHDIFNKYDNSLKQLETK